MKLASIFFKHDINAQNDMKIEKMIFKLGNAGYGIYWRLVEIAYNDGISVNDIDFLCFKLNTEKEIVMQVLNDFDLFYIEDGQYTSNRIKRGIEEAEAKSILSKKAVQKRINKNKNNVEVGLNDFTAEDIPTNNLIQPAEGETVTPIIEPSATSVAENVLNFYQNIFRKNYKMSWATEKIIEKITEDNNLSIADWNTIMTNANKGWNFNGKKNKPTFGNIINRWESFLNDDYYLDNSAEEKRKQEEKAEQLKREKQNAENEVKKIVEAEYDERNKAFSQVCNKESAISYIKKFHPSVNKTVFRIGIINELATQYNINFDEVQNNEK